ncbi:outer arm dynein light chain 1 [Coccomyxa subellipsoidea C-169]|uniref:Outer arm dynein light chain 1 n=1 Tax=Coccomyxa subellipsoidea (strain C-169) TaxID=574566 RepID=I0YT43_COCSC|nr:outer arm dynein light chain 1 [Coccomyxa subellipsoidea C-169]EIE21562.1 outer arm dynein light chain 1 [Coccomyxa subellipsoidea C-169]|eukprot:XP_005646106.1 outer arm dynein light chain 1 [Coccomyxa subellipsoidea C-169]
MTIEELRKICKQHELYLTPGVNDKLFCNLRGFRNIANLEPYTGLKALFLEGNALQNVDGLPRLELLRCLFLQQNAIHDLSGLHCLPGLEVLNISTNHLEDLSGIVHCSALQTLLCSNNKLSSYESIAHIRHCQQISTLDLRENEIEDPEVLEIFAGLPQLRCLYLKGNPVVESIRSYRKTVISRLPGLTYLDERPIFDVERRCAEAWCAQTKSPPLSSFKRSSRSRSAGSIYRARAPFIRHTLLLSFPTSVSGLFHMAFSRQNARKKRHCERKKGDDWMPVGWCMQGCGWAGG